MINDNAVLLMGIQALFRINSYLFLYTLLFLTNITSTVNLHHSIPKFKNSKTPKLQNSHHVQQSERQLKLVHWQLAAVDSESKYY